MRRNRLPELPDNELIPLCLDNQSDAWEELVRRHRRRVFNIAYQFVGRYDVAEDLSQELFLKIHGALHRYDRSRNFVFWLSRLWVPTTMSIVPSSSPSSACLISFVERKRDISATLIGHLPKRSEMF